LAARAAKNAAPPEFNPTEEYDACDT